MCTQDTFDKTENAIASSMYEWRDTERTFLSRTLIHDIKNSGTVRVLSLLNDMYTEAANMTLFNGYSGASEDNPYVIQDIIDEIHSHYRAFSPDDLNDLSTKALHAAGLYYDTMVATVIDDVYIAKTKKSIDDLRDTVSTAHHCIHNGPVMTYYTDLAYEEGHKKVMRMIENVYVMLSNAEFGATK